MLLHKKYILIVLMLLGFFISFSQSDKADKLYDKAEYIKAIEKYEKALKTNNITDKQSNLIKLADCYHVLSDFKKSEEYYRQALALGNIAPEVNYEYGNVLKANNNYTEALTQYLIYLQAKPMDKKGLDAVKSCQEIKYWLSKPQEYQVKLVDAINTERSEFCPVMQNGKLVYIGEKQTDYLELSTNEFNGQPFLNVYRSDIKNNDVQKSVSFSNNINTNFHDGPVSFSEEGTTLYLTRVNYVVNKRNKDFVNRAKLYTLTGKNKKWRILKSFPYNSDEYSCAHASVSADGTTLYFVSDMPGGFGGKDIWMCKKNGDSWDKPVNLGVDINTSGDEMFPCIRKDSVLFFSSNGLPGFGGLDILSAKQTNGKWLLNRNEGFLLNSTADDFGITFVNDSTGYFSSNRIGGKGKDDIYSFIYSKKYITVDGIVLLTENVNDPAQNRLIYLLNDKGVRLDSTKTNNKGYFAFRNLEAYKNFMAEVSEDSINLKIKSRYYMADINNNITRVTHNNGKGKKFVFRNLPVETNSMSDLYNDDDLSLSGKLFYGDNPTQPIANKKVVIRNQSGDVLEQTTTNQSGAFAFRNLPIDQNYTIAIEDEGVPANAKIALTSRNGKPIKTTLSDAAGKFKFTILSTDKLMLDDLMIDDALLVMALNGYVYDQDKKALSKVKITVLDKNEVIENIITDENGKFQFRNLRTDKNYLFAIDDSEQNFTKVTKIYVADEKGRIYKELTRNANGKFQFDLLELDKNALGDYSVEDVLSDALTMKNKQKPGAVTTIENLYYAYGDYTIDAAGQLILDRAVAVLNSNISLKMEISSHADSRSSDAYNLVLSRKRAKAVVEYLIAKGIQKSRLKAIGYGEQRLINNCGNKVPCTEEEHAKNRCTEFKIIEVGKL